MFVGVLEDDGEDLEYHYVCIDHLYFQNCVWAIIELGPIKCYLDV
jgi:hypothetical protein